MRFPFFSSFSYSSFFSAIALLNQPAEKKEEIASVVIKDSQSDRLYWMEIILSGLIATFGLLQNSVAVIIGAMLIAPLLRPMQAMGFGIASGKPKIFWQGSRLLLKSIIVAVGISFLFTLFIPLKTETSEILARTAPNLLDFFIAVFSAIIAFLSLSFQRLSSSVAGVAMAAALMPPLCTMGIELSLLNFSAVLGSFLLFLINLLAIVLVGVIMFLMYGFTPHQQEKQKRSNRNILILLCTLFITLIPLTSSLLSIASKIKIEQQATSLLQVLVPQKITDASLTRLSVVNVDHDTIVMKGEIQVPENTQIFKSTYNSLLGDLEQVFEKKIILDFQMIRTANLSSAESPLILKQKILNEGEKIMTSILPQYSLLQADAHRTDEGWKIKNIISIPPGLYISEEEKNQYINTLQTEFTDPLEIEWISVAGSPKASDLQEKTREDIIRADIISSLQELFIQPQFKNLSLENITIQFSKDDSINIHAHIFYPWVPSPPLAEKTLLEVIQSSYSIGHTEKDIQENSEEEKSEHSTPSLISLFQAQDSTHSKNPHTLSSLSSEELIDLNTAFTQFIQTLPYENITSDIRYIPYSLPSAL